MGTKQRADDASKMATSFKAKASQFHLSYLESPEEWLPSSLSSSAAEPADLSWSSSCLMKCTRGKEIGKTESCCHGCRQDIGDQNCQFKQINSSKACVQLKKMFIHMKHTEIDKRGSKTCSKFEGTTRGTHILTSIMQTTHMFE